MVDPTNKILGNRKAKFMQWLKTKGLGMNDTITEFDGVYNYGVVGFDDNWNAGQQSFWETKVKDYIKNEFK